MDEVIQSLNDVPIRLTAERWAHITEEHCELAGMRGEILETVADPLKIVAGNQGELIAVREGGAGKVSCCTLSRNRARWIYHNGLSYPANKCPK